MKYTFIAIFLMLGVTMQAQYKVSFVKPTINGSKFRVTLKMHSEGAVFHLGSNNLRFNYATQDLANPVIVSEHFPAATFGETTLIGSNPKTGIVSINTAYVGKRHARSLKINDKGTELVTIEFDILKAIENTPLTMRIEGAQPRTTALMDDARSVVKLDQTTAFTANLKKATLSPTNNADFLATPNPTNGITKLVFDAQQEGEANLTVYSVTGQVILQKNAISTYKGKNNTELDLSNLPNGFYNISIQLGNEKLTQRVLKF